MASDGSKLRRWLRRTGLAVLSGLAALLLALALGCLVPRGGDRPPAAGPTLHRILVLASAIHTDIALPIEPEVARRFAFLTNEGLPIERASHIVVGRGGRAFYLQTPTWSDLKADAVLRSFGSDEAVMHVALSGPLGPSDGRVFDLDDEAFAALLADVEAGFLRDGESRPVAIPGASYGPYDRFYEATGRFNAFLGCNVWTAAALRAAGIRTGLWTPLPPTLLWSLDLWN